MTEKIANRMISRRARQTSPFLVMDILERASEMENAGVDVIHHEVGEPDFPVPPSVKEATLQTLQAW